MRTCLDRPGGECLTSGARAAGSTIEFEAIGGDVAPAVAVLGGITAGAHVCRHGADSTPGWWDDVVGTGRAIDTCRHRVVSFEWLGTPGSPIHAEGLPPIAPEDQAIALRDVLDTLRIERLHAIVGASYGGMVALAFAALFPTRLERAVVVSAAHESHPLATALRALQRDIVRLGQRSARTREALALARALAITTYRTAADFHERFECTPRWDGDVARFDVEDYLGHHGRRFATSFDADAFVRLSESLDLHRVDPARIRAPVTLIAIEEDALVPPWQMEALRAKLPRGRLVRLSSRYGHDAFLKEPALIGSVIREALADGSSLSDRTPPADSASAESAEVLA